MDMKKLNENDAYVIKLTSGKYAELYQEEDQHVLVSESESPLYGTIYGSLEDVQKDFTQMKRYHGNDFHLMDEPVGSPVQFHGPCIEPSAIEEFIQVQLKKVEI